MLRSHWAKLGLLALPTGENNDMTNSITLPINKAKLWLTPRVPKTDLRRQLALTLEADCAKAFSRTEGLLTPKERAELRDAMVTLQGICDSLWQSGQE